MALACRWRSRPQHQKQTLAPPSSRASLLVGHVYARIVSPHGSLQLRGINLLTLCPLGKVGRAIRWISAPPLEHAGVDRLVDVDVASVFSNIRLSARWCDKEAKKPERTIHSQMTYRSSQSAPSERHHPDRPPIGTKVPAIPPSSSSSAAEPEQEDRSDSRLPHWHGRLQTSAARRWRAAAAAR